MLPERGLTREEVGWGGGGKGGMVWVELREDECRWERWFAGGGGTSMMAGLETEGVWTVLEK